MVPPVTVKPVCPVKSPPEVIVPVPSEVILPEVEMWSPVVTGERVLVPEFLFQKPTSPPPPEVIEPEQVKLPVVSSTVQPVDPDPPAKFKDPPAPGLTVKEVAAVEAEITGVVPAKVKAVEVSVLELTVEEKVTAPAICKVPLPVVEIPPEVVMESPAVEGERLVPALVQ